MDPVDIKDEPFPAKTREASGVVNGVQTDVSSTSFLDKIMVTVSQDGRLSQWIQVPITPASASMVGMGMPNTGGAGLLPSTHLTPRTLLGGGGEDRETLGQLYAAQIASHILTKVPDERRILVLGLGLQKLDYDREAFFDLIELVQKAL